MSHEGPREAMAVSGSPWTSTDFPASRTAALLAGNCFATLATCSRSAAKLRSL
jgi:hypothetical protein